MKKQLVIVGNGPLPRDLSAEIDAADRVVRFNNPKLSIGSGGEKTDLMLLATSAKQMQQWLTDASFLNGPFFHNTPEILFAIHPRIIRSYHHKPGLLSRLKGRKADWTTEAIDILGSEGKRVRIEPPQTYYAVCAELGVTVERMREVFPSTGFIGIWLALRDFPAEDWDIAICGFGWQGWKRHDWKAERGWVEARVAEGRIRMLD